MRRLGIAALLPLALIAFGIACSDDPAAPGPVGPEFGGVSWVAPDRMGRLVVAWKAAPSAVSYRVYASLIEGRTLRNAPIATVVGTALVVVPTTPGERHFVTVRAVDGAGVEDGNTLEKSAVASPDTTPPLFSGARTVSQFANAGATVTWDPATDESSPQEAIAYDLYAGKNAQTLAPVGRSAPGERSLSVAVLGNPGQPFVFMVRARDAADNVSADTPLVSGPLGADTVPPTFAGCGALTNVGSRTAMLTWVPAADDHSTSSAITYEIYSGKAAGMQDFLAAPLAKVKAASSIALQDLQPGKPQFFVCRARDAAGNVDTNKVEKAATTAADVIAPVFGGATDATVDGVLRTVLLGWTPATDETTGGAAIVYDVYESKTPGVYDFTAAPRASSAPGATTLLVTDLEPRSTLNWVVRARDAAFNHDTNVKEKSGAIKTSFGVNVLPILVHDCAVVGCHVSGAPPAGLNLAPPFAYDNLVGVTAAEQPAKMRISQDLVDPLTASYLYEKITAVKPFRGSQMPAPQTGNVLSQTDKDILTSWILEGAPRN